MAKRNKRQNNSRKLTVDIFCFSALIVTVAAALIVRFYFAPGKTPGSSADHLSSPAKSLALREIEEALGSSSPDGSFFSVPNRAAADQYLEKLKKIAERNKNQVFTLESSAENQSLSVRMDVGGQPMTVHFHWSDETSARLAIVIDDMGRSIRQAETLLQMDAPVVLSVLPDMANSEKTVRMTVDSGREALLHLPMEPQNYPETNPGKNALLASMDEDEIRRLTASHLNSMPGVSGVNNHMGSKLTENETAMQWVVDELRKRNLYFLDSLTTGNSAAAKAAAKAGIGWTKRDIFLDNEKNEEAIGIQFERAIETAKKHGRAIAIGHPHDETLQSLKIWLPRIRQAGVEIVPLRDLIVYGDGV